MMKADQGQRLLLLHKLLDGRHGAGDGGLVVCDDQIDLLAIHPSGRVDLLDGKPDCLDFVRALARPDTRKGRSVTDPDVVRRCGITFSGSGQQEDGS